MSADTDSLDEDPFGEIGQQLLSTPQSSQDLIERALTAGRVDIDESAEFPVVSARSWASTLVNDALKPPEDAIFVPIAREEGACDVIRTKYRVGGSVVEIAQTKFVICVHLHHFDAAGPSDVKRMESAARATLRFKEKMSFRRLGDFRSGSYSEIDETQVGVVDADWPHWVDLLVAYCDGNEFWFITLKATGGPTREVKSVEIDDNRHWFSIGDK